jgi:histone H3/H4
MWRAEMAAKKKATKKKATKKKAAKKSTKKAAKEMLLVGSKAKTALKASGCNVAGDALEGLNDVVHGYIEAAGRRAQANGRKTIRAHDFVA